jgi:hypothetical protein
MASSTGRIRMFMTDTYMTTCMDIYKYSNSNKKAHMLLADR